MKAWFYGLGLHRFTHSYHCRQARCSDYGSGYQSEVVEMTNAGHLHIIEPGIEEMLKEVLEAGMLNFYHSRNSRCVFYGGAYALQGKS